MSDYFKPFKIHWKCISEEISKWKTSVEISIVATISKFNTWNTSKQCQMQKLTQLYVLYALR